jgi:Na+/melibiose symporter-like transporter
MLLITFFTTRERIVPSPEQKSSIKDDLSDLSKNRPWLIMLTLTILVFITLAMKGGSYVYYFYNFVDQAALAKFISPVIATLNGFGINFFGSDPVSAGLGLFNAGGIIFQIVGISLSKMLADKYGKRDVYIYGLLVSTLFILAFFLFKPENIFLMFGSQILHGFFYGITIPILWAMIADVADFSEWKTTRRATAIIFSAMMVGLKAGLSVGSALVTWILGLYGYIALESGVTGQAIVQPHSVAEGARLLVSVYPSIPFLIGVGLLFFYVIDKKMETKIEADLKARRAGDTTK